MEKLLKYHNTKIVFQEVPNEISLAINISGCTIRCRECHSKYLWKNIGESLSYVTLEDLIQNNKGITCVCFMGGDRNPVYINKLAKYIKLYYPNLKVAWYSGRSSIPNVIELGNFDYIKIGRFIKERGPLNNPKTNQIFYEIINDNLINKTSLFWKKELN